MYLHDICVCLCAYLFLMFVPMCLCVYISVCISVFIHIRLYVHVCIHFYVYLCSCLCVFMCLFACDYVSMYMSVSLCGGTIYQHMNPQHRHGQGQLPKQYRILLSCAVPDALTGPPRGPPGPHPGSAQPQGHCVPKCPQYLSPFSYSDSPARLCLVIPGPREAPGPHCNAGKRSSDDESLS